jgi:hypothetical protein
MKIKTFTCNNINQDGLDVIENNVNNFAQNHDVIDIKANTICNEHNAALIYTVIYR